jgi:hypothetical protein
MKYTCIFENFICVEPRVCCRGLIETKKKFGRQKSAWNPQKNFNEHSLNYFEEETHVTGPAPPPPITRSVYVRYTEKVYK